MGYRRDGHFYLVDVDSYPFAHVRMCPGFYCISVIAGSYRQRTEDPIYMLSAQKQPGCKKRCKMASM